MKKSKKLLAMLMGTAMLTTSLLAGGCGNAATASKYKEGATEGRPNYNISEDAPTFDIWSYGQTCDDHYFISSEPIYFLDEQGNPVSMMDDDRMQELVDANFNTVFIDYSHSGDQLFMTHEEWIQTSGYRTLNLVEKFGLKAFMHGGYLNPASRGHELKDDDGNFYKSRIQPHEAESFIGAKLSDVTGKLYTEEYNRLTAIEEQDGAFAAEVTPALEAAAKLAIRERIQGTVTTEAESGSFADENKKAAWIASETTARYDAYLATEEATNEIAQAVENGLAAAVDAKIVEAANEYAEENADTQAMYTYWKDGSQTKFFRSEEEYKLYAASTMANVIHHPAFYGLSAIDEPPWYTLWVVGEAINIWKDAAKEYYGKDLYVMFNMLPVADTPAIKGSFCEGGAQMNVWDAYDNFMQTYKECIVDTGALDYYQYDDYPVYNTGLRETYFGCHQITSEFCAENDLKPVIAMQSYGSDGQHRFNDYEDVLWQANVSMAFGKKEYSYYTWWPVLNTTDGLLYDRTYPLTRFGERTELYYSISKVNRELLYNGKYLMNFDYVTSTYEEKLPLPTGIASLTGFHKHDLQHCVIDTENLFFEGATVSGGVIIVGELYDKIEGQWGYYVVNATDPLHTSEATVTLQFPEFNNVQIVQSETTSNVALDQDHKISFELGTGRGAFFMPY